MSKDTVNNPRLRLLNALWKDERIAFATFAILKGARAAQVLAHTGLDAVVIDCEHGNIDDSDMHDMVSAIAGSGVSPVIRLADLTPATVKRALDTGAHGILVPMINNAGDARSVVSLSKFPPTGTRGQGSMFACFELGLDTPGQYVSQANESLINMIQIETGEALRNINQICQVDRIDVIVIGPGDLALDLLGYTPAKYTESIFLDAIDTIVKTARRFDKKTGIVVVDGEHAQKVKDRFDLIILSADVRALRGWYGRELIVARS